jgi:dolichol-phosphate mannosyltransferase
MAAAMTRTLVVIPTYNERDSLAPLVAAIRSGYPDLSLLVVDDASPDGTGRLADELSANDTSISVLHRAAKDGLGVAYRAGFEWGLKQGYERFVEMDADGSHAPADLQRLLNASHGADLVIGSRWVPGGQVLNWPRRRLLISRAGTQYARLMLRLPVQDATAGFRVLSRRAVEAIDLDDIASHGYCFQIDVTRRLHRAGLRIAEVPVTFVERTRGRSKMTLGIVFEALWRVTWWGLARKG